MNLRHHSQEMDAERALAERLGMRWLNIPISAWWRPSREQIQEFLAVTEDPTNWPIFVHCRLGRNRAGVMVAIWRIVHHGWTPDEAYAEAHRFGLSPWNFLTRHLIFHAIPRTGAVGASQLLPDASSSAQAK